MRANPIETEAVRQHSIASELSTYVDRLDATDALPEPVAALAQEVVSAAVPREFGGQATSLPELCKVMEEIAYVCPAVAPYIEAGLLFSGCMEQAGTDCQKEKYLSSVGRGSLGAFALTDQSSGSSPRSMRTHYDEKANKIFGVKRHITFIDRASFFVCFALEKQGEDRISAFLFENPARGVVLGKRSEWLGLRGHHSWEVLFEGAVPTERVGAAGQGLSVALGVLSKTRVSLAAGFVGLAQSAFDCAASFCRGRTSGGRPLSAYQGVVFPLADVHADITAARLAVRHAAGLYPNGAGFECASASAKLLASKTLLKAVNVCSATLGGESAHVGNPSAKIIRDAHTWIAAQGTDNMLRMIVSRSIFGSEAGKS